MKETQDLVYPVETTLSLIGDKWEMLILSDLMLETKRFRELRKRLLALSVRRDCQRS